MQITSNAGEQLRNLLESMNERGIPLFTSPEPIRFLATEFQARGHLIKDLAITLGRWAGMSEKERETSTEHLVTGWQNFEGAKDALVGEINRQIKKLG